MIYCRYLRCQIYIMFFLVIVLVPNFHIEAKLKQNLEVRLSLLEDKIEAGDYGKIKSFLIWHKDRYLMKSYPLGNEINPLSNAYSATKSVSSALLGIALSDKQHINTLNEPILSYFSEYKKIKQANTFKRAITLHDLLTMRAGFEWNELSTPYGYYNNSVSKLIRSKDWIKHILDQPVVHSPGQHFNYNSGETILIGAIIAKLVDQKVETYANMKLFKPLGITNWFWQNTSTGSSNTGWGLWLHPEDMIKLGRLFLNEGQWEVNGENIQVIPKPWILKSTQSIVKMSNIIDFYYKFDYGYQWWRFNDKDPIVADLKSNDIYFAWGYGGQFIFIVPHMDLVIVSTAKNYNDSDKIFKALSEFIFSVMS